jgi:hypothetical protein
MSRKTAATTKVIERRCHACGEGRIRPLAKRGRRVRYKAIPSMEIPAEIAIPTCDKCGAEWLDHATAHAIDEALERRYRDILYEQARRALVVLVTHTTQGKLETILGLSHGYLSKIRSGNRVPSPELVSHLALLARDPKRRLHELEELWGHAA